MHTQIAETSLRTYRAMKKDGTLSQRQRQIMAVIGDYPRDYSLQELAKATGLPINVVSGRVNELRNNTDELERGPARACKVTGNTIRPVRRKNPQLTLL